MLCVYSTLQNYKYAIELQIQFTLYYCTVYMQNFCLLGIALQGMDDHEEAMVAFSQGLATNPKENAMLTALVETMCAIQYARMVSLT